MPQFWFRGNENVMKGKEEAGKKHIFHLQFRNQTNGRNGPTSYQARKKGWRTLWEKWEVWSSSTSSLLSGVISNCFVFFPLTILLLLALAFAKLLSKAVWWTTGFQWGQICAPHSVSQTVYSSGKPVRPPQIHTPCFCKVAQPPPVINFKWVTPHFMSWSC